MDPVRRLIQLCQSIYDAGTSEPGHWASMQKPLVRMALETIEELAAKPAKPRTPMCRRCQQRPADGSGIFCTECWIETGEPKETP